MSDERKDESKMFYIETERGTRVSGPYSTSNDAMLARVWVEKVKHPETFWVRSAAESRENWNKTKAAARRSSRV